MAGTGARMTSGQGIAIAILGASALVVALALAASFRMELGEGVSANAARGALAAAGGGLFALAGALRRVRGAEEGPYFELALYGGSAGGAAGAALGVGLIASSATLGASLGALLVAALSVAAVRLIDRHARLSNLGAGLLLALFIVAAALAGSFGAEQAGLPSTFIAWLLGDFSTATAASAGVAMLVLVAFTIAALRVNPGARGESGGDSRGARLAPLALGFGIGLVGVLGFVGSFVPRAVRALASDAPARVFLVSSVVAGGATVAAIDAVPRLLIGGYALPFAVSTGMLAVPIFLGWNRGRLRREVGPARVAIEVVEIVLIGLGTLVAASLAGFLTMIVRGAT